MRLEMSEQISKSGNDELKFRDEKITLWTLQKVSVSPFIINKTFVGRYKYLI